MQKFTAVHAAIVGIVVAGLTLAPAQSALASPSELDLPHCAIEIFLVEEADHSPPEAACFATEEEVAAFVAGNPSNGSGSRLAAASVAVGTVYKDAGGAGGSLTFWGTSGCSGVTFGFPVLASGWDNSISSMRATNGCWGTMYRATNYGGASLNCTPYCSAIGTWNDSVKSLVFRPTGSLG